MWTAQSTYLSTYYTAVTAAPFKVTFNQSAYSIIEGDGPVQPVLVLDRASPNEISVQVRNTDPANNATSK